MENYLRYRPGYPQTIVDFLSHECGLSPKSIVADVGSGTGKLTELLLKNGNTVFGVEPNPEMRHSAEDLLKAYPNFKSIDATAEATALENHSVDIITAGQAFHWFNREPTRKEFLRILKPGGWVALIWNDRNPESSPFLEAYEQLLLTYATDYRDINHRNVDATIIGSFFDSSGYKRANFANGQTFDFEGLKGRLLSSSYSPEAGHPNHLPMLKALRELFNKYQENGTIFLQCDTAVYYGKLAA